MPNPLYQQLFGGGMPVSAPQPDSPMMPQGSNNPMQKMAMMMRAISNPVAFVKQYFPDIPDNIQYNSNQVFDYLQRTRPPVSEQQIREAQQMTGQILGQGTVR